MRKMLQYNLDFAKKFKEVYNNSISEYKKQLDDYYKDPDFIFYDKPNYPNIFSISEEIIKELSEKFKVTNAAISNGLFYFYKSKDKYIQDLENGLSKKNNRFDYIFNIGKKYADFPNPDIVKEYIYIFEIVSSDFKEFEKAYKEWYKRQEYPKYQIGEFLNFFRENLLLSLAEIEKLEPKNIIENLNKKRIIPREGIAVIKTRGTGQKEFRKAIIEHYGYKCAVCGLSMQEVLEAAHIIPYSKANDEQKFDYQNGIALCANHHKMFDSNILQISPDYSIHLNISPTENKKHLDLIEKKIILPSNIKYRPNPGYLKKIISNL